MGVQSYRSALTSSSYISLLPSWLVFPSLSWVTISNHHHITCIRVCTYTHQPHRWHLQAAGGVWFGSTEGVILKSGFFIGLLAFLLSLTGCQTRGCQTREVPRTYNLSLACGQYIVVSPPGATTILQGSSDWTMLGKGAQSLMGSSLPLSIHFLGMRPYPP